MSGVHAVVTLGYALPVSCVYRRMGAGQDVDMHFGSPGAGGSTFGHVRAALELTFLNSAVDANGMCLAL